MRKGILLFTLVVCLLLVKNAWALTPVLDTGDPNERVCNLKSYTYIDNGIVRDNVTGLEWIQDGNLIVTRDPDFDNDGEVNDGAVTWQHALDYIAMLNADEYLGHGDWRLPTIEELSTIVDASRVNSSMDPIFTNNNLVTAWWYWSATPIVNNSERVWTVSAGSGKVFYRLKNEPQPLRAVRGEPYGSEANFIINDDGTAKDTNTGLVWQQCNYGQTWDGIGCTGSADTQTWEQAVAYVQELNANNSLGYDDWRLPTRNELQSLVDYGRIDPATVFLNTIEEYYWSFSTYAGDAEIAWSLDFGLGNLYIQDKNDANYVRTVRGGLCMAADFEPPDVTIMTPQANVALQDGVTFQAEVVDENPIAEVYFSVREPDGGEGFPIGYDDMEALYNSTSGFWELPFDTTLLQDGYYLILAHARDEAGNGHIVTVPFIIRNWAVITQLPSTPNSKAGRTMPVKFSLRVAASVDPAISFVHNKELEIRIYDAKSRDTILQSSVYGAQSTDYRIDLALQQYQTNFQTKKTPETYVVEIWRPTKNFMIGSFAFKTLK